MTTPAKPAAKNATAIKLNVDTSQAVADIEKLAAALTRLAPKAGVRTSELYVAAFAVADDLALSIWGTDWGMKAHQATVISIVTSAVSLGYVLARTWLKARHVKAALR